LILDAHRKPPSGDPWADHAFLREKVRDALVAAGLKASQEP
jgi:hypothetical protein